MNISVCCHPSVGQNDLKWESLCLNVSQCIPTGLEGKQGTCVLKAGGQEEPRMVEMVEMQNDEIENFEVSYQDQQQIQLQILARRSYGRQQHVGLQPIGHMSEIYKGGQRGATYTCSGYIDAWALSPSPGQPMARWWIGLPFHSIVTIENMFTASLYLHLPPPLPSAT